jgi:hypothetical protein
VTLWHYSEKLGTFVSEQLIQWLRQHLHQLFSKIRALQLRNIRRGQVSSKLLADDLAPLISWAKGVLSDPHFALK